MSQHPILTRFSTSLPKGQRVSVRTASQLVILLAAVIEPWLLETLGPARPIIGPFPQNCPSHHSSSAPTLLQSTPRGHNPSCLSEPTPASCRPGRKPLTVWLWPRGGTPRGWRISKVPRAESFHPNPRSLWPFDWRSCCSARGDCAFSDRSGLWSLVDLLLLTKCCML